MSKEVKFTYFLNGKKIKKEKINWKQDVNIKVIDNNVFITKKVKHE